MVTQNYTPLHTKSSIDVSVVCRVYKALKHHCYRVVVQDIRYWCIVTDHLTVNENKGLTAALLADPPKSSYHQNRVLRPCFLVNIWETFLANLVTFVLGINSEFVHNPPES